MKRSGVSAPCPRYVNGSVRFCSAVRVVARLKLDRARA